MSSRRGRAPRRTGRSVRTSCNACADATPRGVLDKAGAAWPSWQVLGGATARERGDELAAATRAAAPLRGAFHAIGRVRRRLAPGAAGAADPHADARQRRVLGRQDLEADHPAGSLAELAGELGPRLGAFPEDRQGTHSIAHVLVLLAARDAWLGRRRGPRLRR